MTKVQLLRRNVLYQEEIQRLRAELQSKPKLESKMSKLPTREQTGTILDMAVFKAERELVTMRDHIKRNGQINYKWVDVCMPVDCKVKHKYAWIDAKGGRWLLKEMDTEYIFNCIQILHRMRAELYSVKIAKAVKRRMDDHTRCMEIFATELDSREREE